MATVCASPGGAALPGLPISLALEPPGLGLAERGEMMPSGATTPASCWPEVSLGLLPPGATVQDHSGAPEDAGQS